MAYEDEYRTFIELVGDIQNVLSQIRRIFLGNDSYQGSTKEQNRAYQDLERLSCEKMKDVFEYLNAYKVLTAKTGRMWISSELTDKLFRKLPPIIGQDIHNVFQQAHPDVTIGVMQAITFIHGYLSKLCKRAAVQQSLKDLSFFSKVVIPSYY